VWAFPLFYHKKEHKNGTITYYHQIMGAVIVHPEKKQVIPLCPEPIQKDDGATKSDKVLTNHFV
jgi:hypothetical protein